MIEIDKNERIVKVVRKHWFILLANIAILLFAIALPPILLAVLHLLPIENILSFSGSTFAAGGFFFFAWLLIVWMVAWNMWTNYYLDVLIVTDKRIFDINQLGFFKRLSSSFRIDRIQNVTIDMKGIIQTLLNFGTIRIETAGEREDFIAPYIADPYELKKFINNLQDIVLDKSQLVHFYGESPQNKNKEPRASTPSEVERLKRDDSEGL